MKNKKVNLEVTHIHNFLLELTFAVFLTQFPSNRACYAKMDFYVLSINVPLTYKIIGLGPKRPCSGFAYKQHTRKSAKSHLEGF